VQSNLPHHNPLTSLHIKLSRTAKALKSWAKSLLPHTKIAATICREVVDQLERVQENRSLSEAERNFLKQLKMRILGLTVIEKKLS
jgi:RNA polymerase-interacting CarD/CdnL/TRCF family regulator